VRFELTGLEFCRLLRWASPPPLHILFGYTYASTSAGILAPTFSQALCADHSELIVQGFCQFGPSTITAGQVVVKTMDAEIRASAQPYDQ
jgi:hypothetical protein